LWVGYNDGDGVGEGNSVGETGVGDVVGGVVITIGSGPDVGLMMTCVVGREGLRVGEFVGSGVDPILLVLEGSLRLGVLSTNPGDLTGFFVGFRVGLLDGFDVGTIDGVIVFLASVGSFVCVSTVGFLVGAFDGDNAEYLFGLLVLMDFIPIRCCSSL
jgi:hypothetical protein